MRRLILRPGAIGDCILSLPALEHLATDYTEVWISAPVVPLVHFADRVRAISTTGIDLVGIDGIPVPALLRQQLQGFDSMVSWYGANRPDFRESISRLGVACEFLEALPPASFDGHAIEFFARQVGMREPGRPRVKVAATALRDSLVIHPFSGGERKNWPLASYQALAARLDSVPVEWIAGPEETLDIATRFDTLDQLASWLSGARLYLGNDSGITHLATAVGVPTLALFGPTDSVKWAPRGENVTVLCSEALAQLPVGNVLELVNRLLSSPSPVLST
jgi:heptosyltransferase III